MTQAFIWSIALLTLGIAAIVYGFKHRWFG